MNIDTALTWAISINVGLIYALAYLVWRFTNLQEDLQNALREINHLRHCLNISEANQTSQAELDGMCQALCEGGLPALRGWLLTHPAPTPPEDQA